MNQPVIPPVLSHVIPVLDFSPHGPHNIRTLLDDLGPIPGEVICVFNSLDVFEALAGHPRITRFCFNSQNPGVNRSWAQGLDLALGDQVFFLNADLHVSPETIAAMSHWLGALPDAMAVSPGGADMNWADLTTRRLVEPGSATAPDKVECPSGFLFAIDRVRFLEAGMIFDPRYVPCFGEEWDLAWQLKTKAPDRAFYAVPVGGFEHVYGVSEGRGGRHVVSFGQTEDLQAIVERSARRFVYKWRDHIDFHPILKAWIDQRDSRP